MLFLNILLGFILLIFIGIKIRNYRIYKAQMIIDKAFDFGYKMDWLAIKSTDKIAIAQALGAKKTVPCNWHIAIVEKHQTFISPAIGDWTLVLFIDLYGNHLAIDKLLQSLSQTFGQAHYFASYRNLDIYAWGKYINGICQRLYIDIFAEEAIRIDIGEKESIEYEFQFHIDTLLYPPRGDEEDEYFTANQEDVISMANLWSVSPTDLSKRTDIKEELGLLVYHK